MSDEQFKNGLTKEYIKDVMYEKIEAAQIAVRDILEEAIDVDASLAWAISKDLRLAQLKLDKTRTGVDMYLDEIRGPTW